MEPIARAKRNRGGWGVMIGTAVIDKQNGVWVVVDQIDAERYVVMNEHRDCFMAKGGEMRTEYYVGGKHSLYSVPIPGAYEWPKNTRKKDGTYTAHLLSKDYNEAYDEYIWRIEETKAAIQAGLQELERRAMEREAKHELMKANLAALEQEVTIEHSEHLHIPGMWFCRVYGTKGEPSVSRYFNPQYVREITPVSKPDTYKLKLAGYHQIGDQDKWGFTYVTVWTKFD